MMLPLSFSLKKKQFSEKIGLEVIESIIKQNLITLEDISVLFESSKKYSELMIPLSNFYFVQFTNEATKLGWKIGIKFGNGIRIY